MSSKKYTISLDIGTASVGWAVLNNYTLSQGRRKVTHISPDDNSSTKTKRIKTNLWGVRLFDGANTAEVRRQKRGQRRRILRRTKRLQYLQNIFAQDITSCDPNFFNRLGESFLQDSIVSTKERSVPKHAYPLFNQIPGCGETYVCERAYYDQYPTIYHLRNRLIEDSSQADIRLVYLAIAHIIKYRGHFINQGQDFNPQNVCPSTSLHILLEELGVANTQEQLNQADEILKNQNFSKTKKEEGLTDIFGKELKPLFTAITGNSIDLAKIFGKPDEYNNKENSEIPKPSEFKYSMTAEQYDEKINKLESIIDPDELYIIQLGKNVYESIVLCNILTHKTLSASMVAKYELHKSQLAGLKANTKSNYSKLFKENGIYTQYIDNQLSKEDFYKKLKSILPESYYANIASDIEFETYLQKQRYRDNGAIPYQIHELELIKIIENQSQYYPFLSQADIPTLMKFRIPYYVGPLAIRKNYSSNSWLVKHKDENIRLPQKPRNAHENDSESGSIFVRLNEFPRKSITPWNFDQLVNKEESAVNFIERMTAFCSYLPEEKVLPKNSLLYQEYTIYNELMSCGYKLNEKSIYFSSTQKEEIVNQLFKTSKKVTAKQMIAFLKNNGHINTDIPVSALLGIDIVAKDAKYNSSYSTYIDLIRAGITDQQITMYKERFEEIIKWLTIFEDKAILIRTITNKNASHWDNFPTQKQIKGLSKQRYSGWGRLSSKLLTDIKAKNGKTIIQNLKEEPYNNFMRLLEDKAIKEAIKQAELKGKNINTLNYGLVRDLAGSPALKKGIWQSLIIVKELEAFLGRNNIEKIIIEMAREDGKKNRTKTRRKQIEELYNNFRNNTGELIPEKALEAFKKTDDSTVFDERLFLYFMQNGKCMYSGETLEISLLSSYEVDHIIPRKYRKDDSFHNKVLVIKKENQAKGGEVPGTEVIRKMQWYWQLLCKNNQISPEKLKNLTIETLTDTHIKGFIKRQIVETRQITKHVANILTEYFETENEDDAIYVLTPNAKLTSQFRKEFKFDKNRDINDYHHAHDAYLNAIVANFAYKAYPSLADSWVYGRYLKKYVHKKLDTQIIAAMNEERWMSPETGEILGERDEILDIVRKTLAYRNINIVRKVETQRGQLTGETISSKNANKIPVKSNLDAALYGGKDFVKDTTAYAVIVETAKGKIIPVPIPILMQKQFEKANCKLKFLQNTYPRDKIVKIVADKLPKYTKYKLSNGGMRIMASHQEASSGSQVGVFTPPTDKSSNEYFLTAYDVLAKFIINNKLFADAKALLLTSIMRDNFIASEDKELKLKAIKELMRIPNGRNQVLTTLASLGLGTTAQQLKSGNTISSNTIIIHQSPTGLYQTHVTLQ